MGSTSLERLVAGGAKVVDAPVTGGVARAKTGELTIFASGATDDIATVQAALECFGTVRVVGQALGQGQSIKVVNQHLCSVHKPFDEETVLRELDTPRLAVTLENHTVIGGLFETVASALVRTGSTRRVVPVGLPDEFLDAGALPTLHERYGLATDVIVERVLQELRAAD